MIKTTEGHSRDFHRALRVFSRVQLVIVGTLATRLDRVYRNVRRAAGQSIIKALPASTIQEARIQEADEDDPLAWIRDLLIPPPEQDQVWKALSGLVQPADWEAIGERHDRLLPWELAQRIASAMSQGKSQREVALIARPYLDGSRVLARRAARTFGLQVAHTAQIDQWDQLGELIVGYQVHATKNTCPPSRPWHQNRDKQLYLKDPGTGQKGLEKMPRPPLEAEDASERPPGTPSIAWNCLCYVTPVFDTARVAA